jgi:hypothetical protein
MSQTFITSLLRLLLVVLVCTFMSPSFAWEMMDSHSDETGLLVMGDTEHYKDVAPHHHHHDGTEADSAHSQIGHLLSHLPAVMHQIELMPASLSTSIGIPAKIYSLIQADTAPPYKPPRAFLFS